MNGLSKMLGWVAMQVAAARTRRPLRAFHLDAPEHAHGIALREAAVEELDVFPDTTFDPAARVDELERARSLATAMGQAHVRTLVEAAADSVDPPSDPAPDPDPDPDPEEHRA